MVKVASIKNIIKDLTPRTMRSHARHHSLKHMRSMARSLKNGKTFGQAHSTALRNIGK